MLYTDDYVIAGVLPELANDLDVADGQAGLLVAAIAAASTTPALFTFAARHASAGKTGRYIAPARRNDGCRTKSGE
jgi:predicted MFS family arabinose efflux permease